MLIDHKVLIELLDQAIIRLEQKHSNTDQLRAFREEILNEAEQMEAHDERMQKILETGEDPLKQIKTKGK